MSTYDKTALWQQSMAAKMEDPNVLERDRLRFAYESVRKRAQPVAESIAKDLPDYTVHDITHSDALWEYADLIAGPSYPLNPAEGFVLGCAFLIHDLGMWLAAYPDGLGGLKKKDVWKDIVADLLKRQGVETINESVILGASTDIEERAVGEILRLLHAERADKLAMIHWDSPSGDQRFHLIEDADLREAFGPIIGRIAYSHWWPVEKLAKEFGAVMGALAGFPPCWTVDPLKLSCIIRCADYSHIDERRAPAFLRAIRKPNEDSDCHWVFQSKLYQPRLEVDRLIYTAKSSFSIDEAAAWWVCYDTLSGIDVELRKVDALLADTQRERFFARGVAQAEDPSRVAKLIKTEGWQPVDTRIRVSAVADLVAKLGGKDLYGDSASPPLREMIQNAADAVRARRLIDGRPESWGEIRIRFGTDVSGSWVEVEDSGIGMSEAVLTGPLLDFGTSFWSSSMMRDQLPGLSAKGFSSTGKYGIGFFSVFMWGDRVEVVTQRFDKGRDETLALSFRRGLKERPIMRVADRSEYIRDGGTRVKVWLSDPGTLTRLVSGYSSENLTFQQVCAQLAPCVDVDIKVAEGDDDFKTAVVANDWLSVPDDVLLDRISPSRDEMCSSRFNKRPPLEVLKTKEGRVVGRAAIWNWDGYYSLGSEGVVSVGGFRASELAGIIGVLVGDATRASRDEAVPIIPVPLLKDWAKRQRDSRLSEGCDFEVLESLASVINCIGVPTGDMPIARSASGLVTAAQIKILMADFDEVLLVQDASLRLAERNRNPAVLHPNVLAVSVGSMTLVRHNGRFWDEWPPVENQAGVTERRVISNSLESAVIKVVAEAWGVKLDDLAKVSSFRTDKEDFLREIGNFDGKPFSDNVNIIRKPTKSQ